jgi:hypothetical protein
MARARGAVLLIARNERRGRDIRCCIQVLLPQVIWSARMYVRSGWNIPTTLIAEMGSFVDFPAI